MPTIYGTDDADSLPGTTKPDLIYGYGGNDTLGGSLGANTDTIYGGTGDDSIAGMGVGNGGLYGGDGNDTIIGIEGGGSQSNIFGGNDDDVLAGIWVSGDAGNDEIFSDGERVGSNLLYFHIYGGTGQDIIQIDLTAEDFGVLGNDDNYVYGGDENDKITITAEGLNQDRSQQARVFGGSGNDKIFSAGLNDLIDGDAGRDKIYSSGGSDTVYGGYDGDRIYAGPGDDGVIGDGYTGVRGHDLLDGGDGNDLMSGERGSDTLIGGLGVDTLYGGGGKDVFVFRAAAEIGTYGGNERIEDFVHLEDKIDMSDFEVALTFINKAAFSVTGVAEVRFNLSELTVEGDTNGDGSVDFVLQIYAGNFDGAKFNGNDILV